MKKLSGMMGKKASWGYFLIPVIIIIGLIIAAGFFYVPKIALSAEISTTADAKISALTPLNPLPEVAEVAAKVRPSVVTVNTDQLIGSGWILNSDGLIVTNNHVIEGAKTITVTLDNGQIFTARTTLEDKINDLAIIDIGFISLPAATIGDSSKLGAGDQVLAIGNPQGEGICITQGTIVCTDSTFTVGTRETLYDTLKTNAPITYGNSGGPLFNMDGEVIGVITGAELTWAGTQVAGYAISSNAAQLIIGDLLQNGFMTSGW